MTFPEDVRYTREHEWAREQGGIVTVGITGYATDQLGDVVFVYAARGCLVFRAQGGGIPCGHAHLSRGIHAPWSAEPDMRATLQPGSLRNIASTRAITG